MSRGHQVAIAALFLAVVIVGGWWLLLSVDLLASLPQSVYAVLAIVAPALGFVLALAAIVAAIHGRTSWISLTVLLSVVAVIELLVSFKLASAGWTLYGPASG